MPISRLSSNGNACRSQGLGPSFSDGRLLAANPGPARALVVESVVCPAIHKVRAECLTAWAQLMEGAGGRAPPRPAGTADGRYRRDRGGCASAGHCHRGCPR